MCDEYSPVYNTRIREREIPLTPSCLKFLKISSGCYAFSVITFEGNKDSQNTSTTIVGSVLIKISYHLLI